MSLPGFSLRAATRAAPTVFTAMKKSNLVSIGLRAKTARAIAVVLGGSIDSPVILTKLDIPLADPKMPATAQPYHDVMDLPWEESQRAVQKSAAVIESLAQKALARLIRELQLKGVKICGAGIVGAKDKDLSRIGNPHIRAHAAEGVLIATAELGHQSATVKRKLNDIRRSVTAPWRADEKQAATAAWLVLHGPQK